MTHAHEGAGILLGAGRAPKPLSTLLERQGLQPMNARRRLESNQRVKPRVECIAPGILNLPLRAVARRTYLEPR